MTSFIRDPGWKLKKDGQFKGTIEDIPKISMTVNCTLPAHYSRPAILPIPQSVWCVQPQADLIKDWALSSLSSCIMVGRPRLGHRRASQRSLGHSIAMVTRVEIVIEFQKIKFILSDSAWGIIVWHEVIQRKNIVFCEVVLLFASERNCWMSMRGIWYSNGYWKAMYNVDIFKRDLCNLE